MEGQRQCLRHCRHLVCAGRSCRCVVPTPRACHLASAGGGCARSGGTWVGLGGPGSYTSGVPSDPIAELGAPGQGGQPGAGHRVHRRQGRRPPAPPPTSCSTAARRSSPPTRSTSRRAEADGVTRHRRRPAAADRRPRSQAHGRRPAPGRRPCPTRSARSLDGWIRPNGLRIRRVRVPLGVVAIIYENRPNVTSDAAGLCLKSGNAAFLRGSSGAHRAPTSPSPRCCARRVAKAGLPADAVVLVDDTAPRGRRRVHAACAESSTASSRGAGRRSSARSSTTPPCPYVIDGDGNCHVYVDAAADLDDGARHRRERQDPAARRCATRPSRWSCTRAWPTTFLPRRRPSALDGRRAASATTAPGRSVPGDGRGHRRRLRHASSST